MHCPLPFYSLAGIFPTPHIMKAILPVLLVALSLTLAPAQTDRLSPGGNARISEMGPHHRVWSRIVQETTPGSASRKKNARSVTP